MDPRGLRHPEAVHVQGISGGGGVRQPPRARRRARGPSSRHHDQLPARQAVVVHARRRRADRQGHRGRQDGRRPRPRAGVRLKKYYSSREVASLTGLTARQLQWWDARRVFLPAIAPQRTEAGGFTERRYTPLDVLELQVLADLRRRGFSIPRLRRLLSTLKDVFGVRLYEAIGDGGTLTLYINGDQLYARNVDGRLFNMDQPSQALLMVGEDLPL